MRTRTKVFKEKRAWSEMTSYYERNTWIVVDNIADYDKIIQLNSTKRNIKELVVVGNTTAFIRRCPICNNIVEDKPENMKSPTSMSLDPLLPIMYSCKDAKSNRFSIRYGHNEMLFNVSIVRPDDIDDRSDEAFIKNLNLPTSVSSSTSVSVPVPVPVSDSKNTIMIMILETLTASYRPLFRKIISPVNNKWVIEKERVEFSVLSDRMKWKKLLNSPYDVQSNLLRVHHIEKDEQQLLIEKLDKERVSSILPDREFHKEYTLLKEQRRNSIANS